MNGSEDATTKIDELVRSYLERQIEQLDTSGLQSRIVVGVETSASLNDPPSAGVVPTSIRRSGRPTLTYVLAASVAVVIAFLGGRYFGPGSVSAATVLQSVRDVHAQPVDRCYQVHYVPDSRYWDGKSKLLGPSQSVLWTRGDRFFANCQIGDVSLAIGRDADEVLWVSPSPKKAIVFERSGVDLPSELATLCDINTMSLSKLADDVLADFDFEIEQRDMADGGAKTVIWAEPKTGSTHRFISAAVIEVDETTNAIQRLVLWVLRDGRPNGTVTYTWTETTRRSDESYKMTSHLASDAVIELKRQDDRKDTAAESKTAIDAAPAERSPR